MEHLSNPQVPISAVLKYIVKDRDKYKAKLDQLIPYAKSLEKKVQDLEKEIDGLNKRLKENEVKKADLAMMKQTMNENEFMKEELRAFRRDFKETAWFKQMDDDRKRMREALKKLRIAFSRMCVSQGIDIKSQDIEDYE